MTLQSIIDFLLSVMRDPQARAEFEQNPQAALATAGIEDASAQDVRDAQLQLADRGYVRSTGDGSSSGSGGDDPVQEISYTTRNYQVTEDAPDNITNINNTFDIDDRDITINDSFNSDDDITLIEDSFNKSVENDVTAIQDNDTTVIQDNDTIELPEGTGVAGPRAETAAEAEPDPVPVSDPEPEPPADEVPDEPSPEDTTTVDLDGAIA